MSVSLLSPIRFDDEVASILAKLSPSGALTSIVTHHAQRGANPALDATLDAIDLDEIAAQHLEDAAFVVRLENDFAAIGVPLLDTAAPPLEAWGIPILSAFAGPASFGVSVGLTIACKVALLAIDRWKAKHDAAEAARKGLASS